VYSLLKSIDEYISGVAAIVPSPTSDGKSAKADSLSDVPDVVSELVDDAVVEAVVLEVSLLLVDEEELELPPHPVNRDAVIHILKTVAKNFFFFIRPLLF
jgi:hypothetical protein